MKTSIHGHKYNWHPSLPDPRDQIMSLKKMGAVQLPPVVDLRPHMPHIYAQGKLSYCTANAIGAAIEYEMMKQKQHSFTPSRLFIYYNERAMENDIPDDNGAVIRDGLKTVVKDGACSEDIWPYIPAKLRDKPHDICYSEALKHQVLKYQRVNQTLSDLKTCLAAGYPIIFGISLFESFESDAVAATGIVNMPQAGEKDLGGHAILAVGYNDHDKRFIIRNSWGDKWGGPMAGHFTLPYDYVLSHSLADNFWAINLME